MSKYAAIAISLAFLVYGLLRLSIGSAMLAQSCGLIDIVDLREPGVEVAEFMTHKAAQAFIPLSASGYLGYIALMGAVLTIGAVGSLMKRAFGLRFIGAFLVMYLALFINFATVNLKIIHLAICALLFGVLVWLRRRDGEADVMARKDQMSAD